MPAFDTTVVHDAVAIDSRPNRKHFPKEDFHTDLEEGACTFPAGNVTWRIRPLGTRTAATGRTHQLKALQVDGAICGVCPLRPQCVAGPPGTGRKGNCTRRRRCCSRPGPYSRMKPFASTGSTGWWRNTGRQGWCNWGSASPAASGTPRRNSSCTWRPRWPT